MSYPSLNIAQGIPINVAHTIDSDRLSSATTATARSSARLSATTSADAADTLRSLAYLGIAKGLSNTVAQSVKAHPLRIMIVDNSGSMNTCDGNKMLNNNGSVKMVKCSRWVELSDEVMKVADVSSALNARTDFHLLNPTPNLKQCSIATSAWEGVAPLGPTTDATSLRESLNKVNPTNTTPLTESVMSVISMISPIAADLRASGQQVAVILATDGHPNNRQSFVQAMQQLQLLPVWVVVRLCTDDDDVVSFWNDLDEQLEAPLEVLDDVRGEAVEVTSKNPWLTYGSPLHVARLFGLPDKLFDALDETALQPTQIKSFIETLLSCDTLPEPELDVSKFVQAVANAQKGLPLVFDPISQKMKPWIDLRKLEWAINRKCGKGACAVM